MSPTPAPAGTDARTTRQKSVLFCPECGHESPITGDWQVEATGTDERLTCPACGTTVSSRPRAGSAGLSITLPVVVCATLLARLTTRLFAMVRRQRIPGVSDSQTSASSPPSTSADRQP